MVRPVCWPRRSGPGGRGRRRMPGRSVARRARRCRRGAALISRRREVETLLWWDCVIPCPPGKMASSKTMLEPIPLKWKRARATRSSPCTMARAPTYPPPCGPLWEVDRRKRSGGGRVVAVVDRVASSNDPTPNPSPRRGSTPVRGNGDRVQRDALGTAKAAATRIGVALNLLPRLAASLRNFGEWAFLGGSP